MNINRFINAIEINIGFTASDTSLLDLIVNGLFCAMRS